MLNDTVLKKIERGDIKAFESVFRLYYSSLYFYAFSITSKHDIAEEIVQDLFYIWWRDREKIQIKHSIKSYLYTAVRNKSLQYIEHINVRERYQQNVLASDSEIQNPTPQQVLEEKELQAIIDNTLNRLPERRHNIFKMHRFEGKKYKEIAETLSLSVKTIEAEMSKAYQLLREEVEKYRHNL